MLREVVGLEGCSGEEKSWMRALGWPPWDEMPLVCPGWKHGRGLMIITVLY